MNTMMGACRYCGQNQMVNAADGEDADRQVSAIRTVEDAPAIDAQPITGDTSDGYHTFNELYHHRAVLFAVIVNALPDRAWKSRKHHDGSMYDGMFIVGIETPDGQATYHYDIEPYWDIFDCRELKRAPEWDGHTSAQAIERIGRLKLLKHGQWLDGGECSRCHELDNCDSYGSNYCPHCGAKMDGEHMEKGGKL